MKWSIVIAICLATFGFIPGMGIPGGFVLMFGALVLEPIMKLGGHGLIVLTGDRGWPAALLATLIWPVFIPLTYLLCNRLCKDASAKKRRIVFACLLLVSAVITTAAIEVLARSEGGGVVQK